jgi:SSS family solute:Na+ symporter
MIPPVGICGILVGLYMRTQNIGVTEKAAMAKIAKTALTEFIANHVPHFLGGVMLATLLFAVVGTGAGLALGISTIINNDIRMTLSKKAPDPKKDLLFSRICIIVVLALAVVGAIILFNTPIQIFSYISMGLRGAVMFMPLLLALFAKNMVKKGFATASIIASPLLVLIFTFWPVFKFDPLFLGIALSIIICGIGLIVGKGRNEGSTLS